MEHTNSINSIEDFNIHLRAKYHYPEVYAQRYARATSCAASEQPCAPLWRANGTGFNRSAYFSPMDKPKKNIF